MITETSLNVKAYCSGLSLSPSTWWVLVFLYLYRGKCACPASKLPPCAALKLPVEDYRTRGVREIVFGVIEIMLTLVLH